MATSQWRSNLLLVEDNRTDAALLQMALLQYCTLSYLIHVVGDGAAALAFLHQRAPYPDAPTPDLILLDAGLPQKEEWEVLAALHATPALGSVAKFAGYTRY